MRKCAGSVGLTQIVCFQPESFDVEEKAEEKAEPEVEKLD